MLSRLFPTAFVIDDAENAYELISGDSPSLGILLEYTGTKNYERVKGS